MNRNAIIGSIVVVVLLLLGIWYFSSSSAPTAAVSDTTNGTQASATPTPTATPNTFKSIFAQSGNHECSYQQANVTGQSTSVIFIADGKMRGEFRTVSGSNTDASIIVYNGGSVYSWKEGATVGKKSSITSIAQLPEIIPTDLTSGAVFGTSANNVSWDCHDWLTDPKAFVIPTNITFK